jgi:hypothetical protein
MLVSISFILSDRSTGNSGTEMTLKEKGDARSDKVSVKEVDDERREIK